MPNDEQKVYSAIGMANKAGKLVKGSDACIRAIRDSKVGLVILSVEASENTRKKFVNACKYKDIQYVEFGTGQLLGKMTGKDNRIVIGIKDKNFSRLILSKMHYERELMNEQKNQ